MKIAIIIPALSNKGPVIVAQELCKSFVQRGHYCHVFYFDEILELDFPCGSTRISFFSKIDFEGYDIVHAHCLRPVLYVSIFKTRNSNVKFVSTLHQPITINAYALTNNRIFASLLSFISRIAYNRFTHNVVLSEEQYNLAVPLLHKPMSIIFNGRNITRKEIVSIDDAEQLSTIKDSFKVLGSTSVIIKRKALDQIIMALTKLPEYYFVCVGDGPDLSRIKQLAVQLKVNDRCLWLGYKKDALNYNRYFDIFAITSRSEGFPLSLIEAAAYGKSCVISNIEIMRSVVSDNEVCFFELDDIDSLVMSILKAYQDKDKYENNILNYYYDKLTAEKMADKYLKLFERLTN